TFATWLLALLGAGLMYVSFDAQYQFIFAQKGVLGASLIEAAMLDAGMVILSALGIGLAQAGKPSGSVRVLIMICAGASAGMNLAASEPASWRSAAAYVSAPVFLAVITDRVIAVIRQHVLPLDAESAWAPLGRATVTVLRTVLAPSGTLRALRQMVLDAAPIPGMTGSRQVCGEQLPCSDDQDRDHGADQPLIEFGTKKAAFLSRYRAHPEYGDRSAAGRVAAELAPLAGLQAGTGRTYIAEELRKLAALTVQVAALRGQIAQINQRLDRAGLRGDLDLAARFEDLAQTVADALDAAAPRSPAAPSWIGLGRQAYEAQLAELRQWADTVLRQNYSGYELRDCWPSHIHAIWELSTLAAAWHHTYSGNRPDLGRALEFYDRWLPGTMRRVAHITRTCVPQCVMLRRSW